MAIIGYSLSDYWLVVRKRKGVAILTFLVVFLSAVIHSEMQPSVYRAVSSIRMIERRSVSDMITQMVSHTSFDVTSSITRVLLGRPVIEKVVYKLGWADENTPSRDLDTAILRIQSAASAESELGTNIVKIAVEYEDADIAAKIANAIAEVYIKVDMDEKNEHIHNARIFIEEQLAKSKQRLNEIEEKLQAFKEEGEVSGIAGIIQNNLADLERQKIELRKIYTERYPDVVKINERIESLKEQLKALPESELEYARLTRQFQVDESSYLNLQRKLEEVRIAEAEKVEDVKMVDYAIPQPVPVRPKKGMTRMLGLLVGAILGLFVSFVVETFDTSIGAIEDLESLLKLPVLAVIPYMKTKTKEKKKLLQRLFIGFLSLAGIKTEESDSDKIENMKMQLLIRYAPKSSATEAYRILRTNIKIEELLKKDQRILLLSSTIPREGKSIIAVNLALALAQDGYKTLLVDCDLRKAVVHKIFNIDKEPGLTNVLLDTCSSEEAVRNLIDIMMSDTAVRDILSVPGLDNFNLLTCGKIIANPAELLDSTKIKELFSELRTKYNFIVIDSPPVLPVPDAIILGSKVADKLYLIYRAGYTSKLGITRAKEQLDMIKFSPSGIILNSTTPESQIVSNYYHHYYHYRYYSEKEK